MPALHRPLQTRDRFVAQFGHSPVLTSDAVGAGFTRSALRAALDRGLLIRPRRGVVQAPPAEPGAGGASSHRDLVRAALLRRGHDTLATHESAALLHGIALPSAVVPTTVALAAPGASGYVEPGLVCRSTPVPEHQRTVADGLPVTSIARTAVDLARGRRLPAALIPLDSAARLLVARATATDGNSLRHAVRDPDERARAIAELGAALATVVGWSGTVRASRALAHVDPASESPLESRSRGWFLESGLGALDPGTPVRCAGTTYWADFCSAHARVVGEADGWGKYGATADDARAALEHERERARRLEADGWRLVRWTSSDPRALVIARMRSALGPRRTRHPA